MGLFSTRHRTYVGTSVQRVIQDSHLPNAMRTGVLKGIFRKQDIVQNILEESIHSVGIRADYMYRYAEKHYVHGLPKSQVSTINQGRSQVQEVLNALEGTHVSMEYCRYGPPNILHHGWESLIAEHGYDPITNQLGNLSAIKKVSVYLKDMVIVIPEGNLNTYALNALDQWGTSARAGYTPDRTMNIAGIISLISPSPIHVEPMMSNGHLLITYVWREKDAIASEEATFPIPLTSLDTDKDMFHVKYSVNDLIKYWSYQVGSGVHPTLDNTFDTPPDTLGSYFPFVYFRFNGQSEIDTPESDTYKQSKKMTNYLGMDYDLVSEGIKENPDIVDVLQAIMVMAVPANSTEPIEQRYLFEYFSKQFYEGAQYASLTSSSIQASLMNFKDVSTSSTIIQDGRFKMSLSNAGIYKKRKVGVIGSKGTYGSDRGTRQILVPTYNNQTESLEDSFQTIDSNYYRYQITETLYDEIEVVNLQVRYHITGKYLTIGDDESPILLIPLDRSITNEYTLNDREELYARSLHYVFNSMVRVKLKWYETTLFQVIMIIVGVVIAMWDQGVTLSAILTAQGAVQVLIQILIQLVVGQLVSVALTLFVEAVGIEIAILVAVVAAIYGGYLAYEAGSVAGAPWASELLQLASGLQGAIGAEKMNELMGKTEDFNKYVEDQTKLLDKAEELLDANNLLSPFIIFGETPDDFYNRTVHSGNIGILGIDAISNYVDVALTLPQFKDTIGGFK